MVKLSDILVDKSLHRLGRAQTVVTSFGRKFEFS